MSEARAKLRLACCAALLVLAVAACAPVAQRAGIPTEWQPSPNFDERRPNFVIIHHTTNNTADEALRTLTDPRRRVSSHYLVGRDGRIVQLVDERSRAWHAGDSYWGGDTDLNSSSLGIELDNNGNEPFSEPLIDALIALLGDMKTRYEIPAANFLGHADVAPRRKVDPSRYFPWRALALHGFGIWCDPPYPAPSTDFDANTALQALGYDVSDLAAAARAFKRHFGQDESSPELDDTAMALLNCLIERKRG